MSAAGLQAACAAMTQATVPEGQRARSIGRRLRQGLGQGLRSASSYRRVQLASAPPRQRTAAARCSSARLALGSPGRCSRRTGQLGRSSSSSEGAHCVSRNNRFRTVHSRGRKLVPEASAIQGAAPLGSSESDSDGNRLAFYWTLLKWGAAAACVVVLCGVGVKYLTKELVLPIGGAAAGTNSGFTILRSSWTGLIAGTLHALLGPDHLAALAPLTIGRSRGSSAVLGALWGGGHGTGQLLLGVLLATFKEKAAGLLPALTRWSGALVGITLIIIGFIGWRYAQIALAGLGSGVLRSAPRLQ